MLKGEKNLLYFQMTSVAEKKYSLPSEDKKAQYLLGKILADGLSQNELNAAYDDVSKDYDQVYLSKRNQSERKTKIILLDNKQIIFRNWFHSKLAWRM